jgi:hypothetical protein
VERTQKSRDDFTKTIIKKRELLCFSLSLSDVAQSHINCARSGGHTNTTATTITTRRRENEGIDDDCEIGPRDDIVVVVVGKRHFWCRANATGETTAFFQKNDFHDGEKEEEER